MPALYIGQVRGWAFGLLHLSRDDFYTMRPGEFWEAMTAFREDEEQGRMHIGELVRGAALRLFNLQLQRKDRIADPRKFWRMPWDEDPDTAEAEEQKRLVNLTDEERAVEIKKFLSKIQG